MYPGARGPKAVVVANGILSDVAPLRALLDGADLVAAADGGARSLLLAGVRPHVILGDMDSLPHEMLDRWHANGGEAYTYPVAKDQTDLELALDYVLQYGAQRIIILGALGGRIDHEMANLLLLAAPRFSAIDIAVVDAHTRVVAVRDSAAFDGQAGDTLSLLPITARVEGVTTEGLVYPLHGETLELGPTRGVSNELTGTRAAVRMESGILLAIHSWPDDRLLTW